MRVLIAAGGTGGHIYPGLSIGEKIREQDPDAQVIFVGSHVGMEKKIIPQYDFPLELIRSRGFERGFSKETIDAVIGTFQSMKDARNLLDKYRPDLVISTGGFTGATLLREAQKKKIPTMIHEQNAFPGRANRLSGKKAARVGLAFKEAEEYFPKEKCFVCGNPVREAFRNPDREGSRAKYGLSDEDFLIVVMGGSQGAQSINKAAIDAIAELERHPEKAGKKLRWKILAGPGNDEEVRTEIASRLGNVPDNVDVVSYCNEMDSLLAAADFAVARSGAMSVAEFAACSLPALLVPYPFAAGDHQTFNAKALVDAGAATMCADDKLSPKTIVEDIVSLTTDADRRNAMREAAHRMSAPEAADRFVQEAFSLIGE